MTSALGKSAGAPATRCKRCRIDEWLSLLFVIVVIEYFRNIVIVIVVPQNFFRSRIVIVACSNCRKANALCEPATPSRCARCMAKKIECDSGLFAIFAGRPGMLTLRTDEPALSAVKEVSSTRRRETRGLRLG